MQNEWLLISFDGMPLTDMVVNCVYRSGKGVVVVVVVGCRSSSDTYTLQSCNSIM